MGRRGLLALPLFAQGPLRIIGRGSWLVKGVCGHPSREEICLVDMVDPHGMIASSEMIWFLKGAKLDNLPYGSWRAATRLGHWIGLGWFGLETTVTDGVDGLGGLGRSGGRMDDDGDDGGTASTVGIGWGGR